MPTKLQFYSYLAERTAEQLTDRVENWTSFLTTSSRLYKYPYHEQLMIYAQRPDATACAEYDVWNNRMGRYVRRGSIGIALLDTSSDTPHLRYVFDVSDTGTRARSRDLNLWTMQPEHESPVTDMLMRNYDVSDAPLEQIFLQTARYLAEEYWDNHHGDILDIVDNSFLEEYDDYTIGTQFLNAATVSTLYSLLSRCGRNGEVLADELVRFAGDYAKDRSLLRFHHANPLDMVPAFREIEDMTYEYTTDMTELPEVRQFISEDEIRESFVSHGSGIHNGKYRIYDYLTGDHTDKEKIEFLKNEYGTGGHSHALSGAGGSWEDHDSRGIRLKKPDCANVEMSWTNVLKRLNELIRNDRYLTQDEKEAREAVQETEEETQPDQSAETEEQPQSTVSEEVIPDEPNLEQPEYTTRTVAVYPAEENHMPFEVVIQTIGAKEPVAIPPENFRITDDDLGTGGAKAKFRMNMKAIGTLKQIESENRHATPEEQVILSKYVGWGGLADAFDDSKENWQKEYAELSAALTPEEYAAARSSTFSCRNVTVRR